MAFSNSVVARFVSELQKPGLKTLRDWMSQNAELFQQLSWEQISPKLDLIKIPIGVTEVSGSDMLSWITENVGIDTNATFPLSAQAARHLAITALINTDDKS